MIKVFKYKILMTLILVGSVLAEEQLSDGVRDMIERAENGGVEEQSLLGDIYLTGLSVDVDYERALHWYSMAADSEDSDAQTAIAYMYHEGLGVVKSEVTAAEWYKKAVANGNTMAMNNLGSMYLSGQGVIRNNSKALALIRQASELNEPTAQNQMGIFYNDGDLVEQDLALARDYFLKSAKQGYPEAQHNLGILLIEGKGGDVDAVEAFAWFKIADRPDSRQRIEYQVLPALRKIDKIDAANIRAIEYQALYTERPTIDIRKK